MTMENSIRSTSARPLMVVAGYLVMLAAGLAVLGAIMWWGERSNPAVLKVAASAPTAEPHLLGRSPIAQVLATLIAVLVTGQVLGRLLARFGQPPVIGDILAGIVLGPSLLGWAAPSVSAWLLPDGIAPYLGAVANLGVIFYMFVVGLELDLDALRATRHQTIAISHASIVLPFVLGAALALPLYPRVAPPGVAFTPFALFLGISMSITAFPVLAQILAARGLSRSEMGVTALTCAATDDVTAWCLLALVVGVTRSHVDQALLTIALTVGYIGLMFCVVRPLIARWKPLIAAESLSRNMAAVVFAALLLSALTTEMIGIHAVFGAFLMGAVIPHDSRVARELLVRLEDLVGVLLLPAFFAFTGLRTRIGLVTGLDEWLWTLAIVAVATIGKFGGSWCAARLSGLSWRDGAILGVLMNTRGLMELIVLGVGLELGVISPKLFAMLVIMALATTLATSPIVALIERGRAAR
jgi:Kef-type K+ transport system membrane component KefB